MSRAADSMVMRGYVYGLAGVSAGCLVAWVYTFGLTTGPVVLAVSGVLFVVCAVSRRFPVDFGRATVEIVDVALLAALVLLSPVWKLLVAVPSMLYRDRLRALFVAACHAAQLLAAGYVFRLFVEPLLLSLWSPVSRCSRPVPQPLAACSERIRTVEDLKSENARLRESTVDLEHDLESAHLTFASRLVESLGRKDGHTARRGSASTVYARDLALGLCLDQETAEKLRWPLY